MKEKKKEKEDSILQALEESGVSDPKKVYSAITQAMIGEEKHVTKLKVKQSIPELTF